MLLDEGGRRLVSVLDVLLFFFFFFMKEIWIYALTRHHAEPNNILLTRNLHFDYDYDYDFDFDYEPSFNETYALFVG